MSTSQEQNKSKQNNKFSSCIIGSSALKGQPLFLSPVAAGFPSPADDYIEKNLDLNEYLVPHKAATFFFTVAGDSMIGAGIHDGDILIVDRSLEAIDNKVVIAVLNGEMTVKRFGLKQGKEGVQITLYPENENYQPRVIDEAEDFSIWGVVCYVIHPL